jgi:hypothetical protein
VATDIDNRSFVMPVFIIVKGKDQGFRSESHASDNLANIASHLLKVGGCPN